MVATIMLLVSLVRVEDDGVDATVKGRAARTVWESRISRCRRFSEKAIPLTAIKIVMVVWQIITQVSMHRQGAKVMV